jgi:hypothetical protein
MHLHVDIIVITVFPLSPPQRLLLAVITISIEIHFTTLYMADLGTRAEPLSEGAQAGKGKGEERREASARFASQSETKCNIETKGDF